MAIPCTMTTLFKIIFILEDTVVLVVIIHQQPADKSLADVRGSIVAILNILLTFLRKYD